MHANLWPLSLLIPSLLHEGDITIPIYIEKDHGSSERLRNPDPGMKRKRRDPHQSDSKAPHFQCCRAAPNTMGVTSWLLCSPGLWSLETESQARGMDWEGRLRLGVSRWEVSWPSQTLSPKQWVLVARAWELTSNLCKTSQAPIILWY